MYPMGAQMGMSMAMAAPMGMAQPMGMGMAQPAMAMHGRALYASAIGMPAGPVTGPAARMAYAQATGGTVPVRGVSTMNDINGDGIPDAMQGGGMRMGQPMMAGGGMMQNNMAAGMGMQVRRT